VEGEALTGTNLDDTNPMNNPQFISPVDSRLKATSPAINRGNNAAYLTARSLSDFTGETDPAGQPRLWDGVIDMGAYEFSFTIALSPATPYTMPAETYGCSDCSPLTVTVTNTGSRPTGTLTVALSGANPGTFALSAAALSGIPVGGTGNFVLSPAAGLAAGSYDATVTVSGDNGISASLDVSFTLNRAKPTVGELDFDLSDAVYTDRPRPVGVGVGAAAGVSGLGGITVRYNGLTRLPDEPGTYAVTVDITEGVNYLAVEGLLLGTFTVRAPVQPGPIRRTVTLPSVSGLTTDPPAGRHYVSSGTDFTFTLIPDTPSPNGAPPAVQTNRTALPDADGLRITPNADGSYTVVIRSIRQDLEVAFSAATGADALEQTALTVYAVPGAIAVGNARSEAVDLRIYTLAGTLVRRLTAAPGTTRLTAAPGVYIVVTGDGRRQKTFISD
jgi:hypothetical protein